MKKYETILNENLDWAKATFAKIDAKMQNVTVRSREKLPDGVDENGVHITRDANWWVSGFWGALNYMLYSYTKNEEYLKTAKRSEVLMDEALWNCEKLHHDVGFQWDILSAAGYRLTGDKNSRTRALFAASTLFSRFIMTPEGGYIRAWNNSNGGHATDDWSIIDCLMNLPLLYWASREVGDDRFKQVAMLHADMALYDHLREDGSVKHIVEHNRETGLAVCSYAGQGSADGSSWSRGQAWGLYGFMLSYMNTDEEAYLNAAKQIANYFIANCSDDWLPRVDFRAPAEPVYYDSTAGAIAACGMIELAKALPEGEGGMYMNAAISILRAMEEKFMNWDPATDDMLGYGTVRYPIPGKFTEKSAGVHISIMYGDYFYTEAVLKLLGSDFLPW